MFNKSIAYRLSIFISIAVISVFIAIIVISYLFNSNNLKENIKNKSIVLSSEVIMEVDKQLVSTREIASNISEQILLFEQLKSVDKLIVSLMNNYPFVNAIHVSIDSGVSTFFNQNYCGYRVNDSIVFETYCEKFYHCLTEKEVIGDIVKSNTPGWTEAFHCSRNFNMIVSYYSPILLKNKKNKKIGYVICEVSIDNLNDILNGTDVGENGFAFLLAKDGRFITHPIKDYVLNKNFFSASKGSINKKKISVEEILDQGLSGSFIAYPKFLDGKKHWVHYTRLKEIEWTVIFAMPYNELFEPLYISILKMLFISVLGIIVIFLMIKIITNRLIEPLSEVTAELKQFSSIAGENEIDSLDEIKLVSESLNFMKLWYKKNQTRELQEEKRNNIHTQDLLQAAEIQQSLINTDFSTVSKNKEIDLYAIYKPVRIVSGDLFDYFFIDDEHLVFTIGDVSGKGVPAAFFMIVAQTIIKNCDSFKSAKTVVKKTNNKLHTANQHQFFLTLFLGILNIKTGVLNFCNAAHTPTYIQKLNGEIVELAQSHGLPLGLYANKEYTDSEITLEKGDSIILYTDGITDLQDKNKVHFGNKRFIENLQNLVGCKPKNLIDRIEKSLDIFKGKEAQVDDITLMCIKYGGIKKA
jgi:sigma-B regulation protein RsbU (phosphoserine phosphatase)